MMSNKGGGGSNTALPSEEKSTPLGSALMLSGQTQVACSFLQQSAGEVNRRLTCKESGTVGGRVESGVIPPVEETPSDTGCHPLG